MTCLFCLLTYIFTCFPAYPDSLDCRVFWDVHRVVFIQVQAQSIPIFLWCQSCLADKQCGNAIRLLGSKSKKQVAVNVSGILGIEDLIYFICKFGTRLSVFMDEHKPHGFDTCHGFMCGGDRQRLSPICWGQVTLCTLGSLACLCS